MIKKGLFKMMKIVFFGSDDFALAHLKSLVSDRYHIVACVTQPDRPKGRGMKIIFSPVKEFALKNNIKVFQPETLKDEKVVEILKGFQADVFVVISYGHLLPKDVLEIPRLGALNVHPSLLPQYRGAAPMNWAIIQGEKETAISIIRLNTSLDAGDIVIQEKVKIEEDDTAVTLRTRIMGLGGKLLKKAIDLLAEGKTAFISQDEKQATKAPKLTKEMGLIDWALPARVIHNKIRGLQPWPYAYTFYKGKALKILLSEVINGDFFDKNKAGEIIEISKKGILVQTGKDALLIKRVHWENAKAMDAHSFSMGHDIKVNNSF